MVKMILNFLFLQQLIQKLSGEILALEIILRTLLWTIKNHPDMVAFSSQVEVQYGWW